MGDVWICGKEKEQLQVTEVEIDMVGIVDGEKIFLVLKSVVVSSS